LKNIVLIGLTIAATCCLFGQAKVGDSRGIAQKTNLSGDLTIDLFGQNSLLRDSVENIRLKELPGYKSPLKAALFSAVIPGAGQTYAERYWQGLAFFGAEVGLWVVYAAYQSKANRQTDDFQTFADEHWSVVRYVQWIQANVGQLNPSADVNSIVIDPNTNLPPWQRIQWSQLNAVENQIMQVTGNGFTHDLPQRPSQQYYELIGKYWQFLSGWDDAAGLGPADVIAGNVSPEFINYSHQRGKANSLYAVATTATYVLVANHVLGALEAAWSAALDNSNLKMGAMLQPVRHSDGMVEFVPTATVSVEF